MLPQGFRSAFGFNTNVWAARRGARNHALQRLQGRASLFAPDQDMAAWTSASRPGIGVGLLDCKAVGGGHKVLFHCPCEGADDAVGAECREQLAVVQKLSKEGRMPIQ